MPLMSVNCRVVHILTDVITAIEVIESLCETDCVWIKDS